jgi:hypothetical protein
MSKRHFLFAFWITETTNITVLVKKKKKTKRRSTCDFFPTCLFSHSPMRRHCIYRSPFCSVSIRPYSDSPLLVCPGLKRRSSIGNRFNCPTNVTVSCNDSSCRSRSRFPTVFACQPTASPASPSHLVLVSTSSRSQRPQPLGQQSREERQKVQSQRYPTQVRRQHNASLSYQIFVSQH